MVAILSSCNTSRKFAAGGFLQKRKYNKGYHIDWAAKNTKAMPPEEMPKASNVYRNNNSQLLAATLKGSDSLPHSFAINMESLRDFVDGNFTASISNTTLFIHHALPFIIQEKDSLKKEDTTIDPGQLKKKNNYLTIAIILLAIATYMFLLMPASRTSPPSILIVGGILLLEYFRTPNHAEPKPPKKIIPPLTSEQILSEQTKGNTYALLGLAFSIIALICFGMIVNSSFGIAMLLLLLFGILGFAFSIACLEKTDDRRVEYDGKTYAYIGLAIGIIDLAMFLVIGTIYVFSFIFH